MQEKRIYHICFVRMETSVTPKNCFWAVTGQKQLPRSGFLIRNSPRDRYLKSYQLPANISKSFTVNCRPVTDIRDYQSSTSTTWATPICNSCWYQRAGIQPRIQFSIGRSAVVSMDDLVPSLFDPVTFKP